MGGAHRILVVDDDPRSREALAGFFGRQDGFEVAGVAEDGLAGVKAYETLRPDVVLMDLNMPRLSGVDAIARIIESDPSACVVALTTFDTDEHVIAALRAGASGYLLKDSRPAELVDAVRAALDGEMPLSARVRRTLVGTVLTDAAPRAASVTLSPRHQELVGLLAQGLTNAEMAQRMHLSHGSVKQYLAQVGTRLGASNRTQILIRAVQEGLVDPRLAGDD